MQILNTVGNEVKWMPKTGFCCLAQKHPAEIERCPARMFDANGETCVPVWCTEYTENSGRKKVR